MFSLWSSWFSRKKASRPIRRRPPRCPLMVEQLESRDTPSVFNVVNTNDNGLGSLREAINQANSNPGADLIQFEIPGEAIHTISLNSALPAITDRVTIDGYSQQGATPNTLGAGKGTNANLVIELRASTSSITTGLLVNQGQETILQGLAIYNFSGGAGISLQGGSDTQVLGCFLGLTGSGLLPAGANNQVGILVGSSTDNRIGGLATSARNVISANTKSGIQIEGGSALVQGNLIGLSVDGVSAAGNAEHGVVVNNPTGFTIGGSAPRAGNVISGNALNGVLVLGTKTFTG